MHKTQLRESDKELLLLFFKQEKCVQIEEGKRKKEKQQNE